MDKILGLIGLAKKAGRITAGSQMCEDEIRRGNAKLIIIASDISDNGYKAITDCCKHYNVKHMTYGEKADLGTAVGSEIRTVISVNDEGFARAIEEKITAISEERKG